MPRSLALAVAALFLGAPLVSSPASAAVVVARAAAPATAAPAGAAPDDGDADDAHPGVKATNGGKVDGTVTKVDFQKNRVTVQTAKGPVDVTVLPSTNIQGKNGFDTIADIAKGQHVSIFCSQKGDEKFAQMIQLQK